MQRVGILGGTFDPIHYGHLAIAEEVNWQVGLAQIYVVPAAQQPLKQAQHIASPHQRLAMVRLACADNSLLIPSDIELRRPPPSYTIDTLHEFRSMLGSNVELWFILGADALSQFPRWYAANQILDLARLAVVARPGATIDLATLDTLLPGVQARTLVLPGPGLEIASSELRQRVAQGRPIRYQLPDTVRQYIEAEGLYRG